MIQRGRDPGFENTKVKSPNELKTEKYKTNKKKPQSDNNSNKTY